LFLIPTLRDKFITVRYKEQVEGQRKKETKLIEVKGVEEWEVEKILNKRRMREVNRYLVRWKRFIAESDIWEKKEDLEHTRELVDEFQRKTKHRSEKIGGGKNKAKL